MKERHASHTALVTAYLRAAHQIIDSGLLVLEDPIALPLLGSKAEGRIRGTTERYMTDRAKILRAHIVLRSRYAEDRLKLSRLRGTSQYVLLGAGFDTFAFRQPPWATGLRIYEVDHPGTQQEKQSRIFNAGITVPQNLVFVGIDFERESLEDRLAAANVRKDVPTFFSWLGVTMYLTGASTALACMASRVADAGTDTDAAHTAIADELETQIAQLAAARKKYGV